MEEENKVSIFEARAAFKELLELTGGIVELDSYDEAVDVLGRFLAQYKTIK